MLLKVVHQKRVFQLLTMAKKMIVLVSMLAVAILYMAKLPQFNLLRLL